MPPESTHLLLLAASAVVCLILLIAWLRIPAFLALLGAALLMGLSAGMAPGKVATAFQDGMGATLGGIAGVLGLGTMLGGLLAASGGAEVLARSLVKTFGVKNVHWCLMIVALAVGFTTWFAVGLVMLLPILLTLTKETGQPFLKLALPMLAVLSITHGVMPPHPGPLVAIEALNANMGKVILWALIVAIPMAAVSGPIFAKWAIKRVHIDPPAPPPVDPSLADRPRPSLGRVLAAITLPVLLILSHTLAELCTTPDHPLRRITSLIGNPTVALGIAVLFSGWALGFTRKDALKVGEKSLAPIGLTLLLVGAGGGFNRVLRDSGAADAIGQMASAGNLPPMLFGWVCAAMIRVATGSATVSIIAACGLVAPLVQGAEGLNIELLVVCIGCGSLFLSHLNDAGFWIVKESFGLTVGQTLRTWTVTETLIGVSGLLVCWGLDAIF